MNSNRSRSRTVASLLLAGSLVFGFSACGSSSNDSADDDTEVVDISETETETESPDQSSDPGSESTSSAALPADWPDVLALPDGFTVEAVLPVTAPLNDQKVMAEGPADTDKAAVIGAYTTAFADAGLDTGLSNDTLASGRTDDGDLYSAEFGDGLNDNGNVKLMLSVQPPLDVD